MKTPTQYTATEALKCLSGVTKKRLYEMMKDGEISYSEKRWGKTTRRVIDASELVRVFSEDFEPVGTLETKNTNNFLQGTPPQTTNENRFLQQEINALKEQLHEKKEENEKLWQQLDKSQDTLKAQTMLLQDMREKRPEKPVEIKKSFWGTLIGKSA